MSEKQEERVPESAFEINRPDEVKPPVSKVEQHVILSNYKNYPPLFKHMHFSLKTLPPLTKNKLIVIWALHLLMIFGPLWNIPLCIIEVIFGGVRGPVLKLILSIIFFFFWSVVGYFHFYHGHMLLTQLRGRPIAYYMSGFIIIMRFIFLSITDWGDANGFVALVSLFSKGKILGGIFSIVYIILTIPVIPLAIFGIIFVYRR